MKRSVFSWSRWVAVVLAGIALAGQANAQYPARPVQMVLPVGVGGGTDALARELARRLTEVWGQPVVMDNKPGAGGLLSAEHVIKSAPDGYTIFFSHDGVFTATPLLYNRPDFDPARQLLPITQVGTAEFIFAVNPKVPAKNINELLALMKEKSARKETFSFGTSALGSSDHLTGEQFRLAGGVDMLVVPYRNSGPAMTDMIAGHVQFGVFSIPSALQHVRSGAVRGLAVASARRSPLFPDLPTVSETIPGFVTSAWYGLWVPLGTPRPVIDKINADVRKIMATSEMGAFMQRNGLTPVTSTPEEFAEFIAQDSAKTAKVIRAANVKIQ